MNIKNSVLLFANNINLSFKAMLYRLVVVAVCAGLVVLVVTLNLSVVTESAQAADFFASIKATVGGFLTADFSAFKDISATYKALMALVGEHIGSVIGASVGALLIFWAEEFLLGLSYFAMTKVVDGHMSSLKKTGFMEALFSSFELSMPFEALYALVKILLTAITVGLLVFFVAYTIEFLSVFSLVFAMWLLIFIFSAFYTLTAVSRPSVSDGCGVKTAFASGYGGKNFWADFGSFALAFTVSIVVNVLFFITTFGAGLTISLPLTSLYFVCLKLVIYYNVKNRKYYIDIDNIVTPVKLRKDGELLDNVDAQ